MKQSAYNDNTIGIVGETLALRTNRIWSKGCVEYTKLTGTFVALRDLSGEKSVFSVLFCGKK